MRFVLFVEGHTENKAIPEFLKRWLDPQLPLGKRVGITPVRFDGWQQLVKDSPTKARLHLSKNGVIAVIALLDFYGPTLYPNSSTSVDERYNWAKKNLEDKVTAETGRFFQFFAVHEVEAWLLSDPEIFPQQVRAQLSKQSRSPEAVNLNCPPARLLDEIYEKQMRRSYKKVTYGADLFRKLDPNTVYKKCPYFQQLMDKMLELAKAATA